jgi:hypothetical protein
LPGIPALAILLAKLQERVNFALVLTSLLTPIAMVTFLVVSLPSMSEDKSDKFLLAEIDHSYPLYYLGKRSFSGRFYSNGKAVEIESLQELNRQQKPFFVAMSHQVATSSINTNSCDVVSQNKRIRLLLCKD